MTVPGWLWLKLMSAYMQIWAHTHLPADCVAKLLTEQPWSISRATMLICDGVLLCFVAEFFKEEAEE